LGPAGGCGHQRPCPLSRQKYLFSSHIRKITSLRSLRSLTFALVPGRLQPNRFVLKSYMDECFANHSTPETILSHSLWRRSNLAWPPDTAARAGTRQLVSIPSASARLRRRQTRATRTPDLGLSLSCVDTGSCSPAVHGTVTPYIL
jgi:hypothetical protein